MRSREAAYRILHARIDTDIELNRASGKRPTKKFEAGSRPSSVRILEVSPQDVGSTVTIYVYLLGEGVDVWRPVQADRMGRNAYRIVSRTPRDERWEFGEDETVRCETRELSGKKSLVAVARIVKP